MLEVVPDVLGHEVLLVLHLVVHRPHLLLEVEVDLRLPRRAGRLGVLLVVVHRCFHHLGYLLELDRRLDRFHWSRLSLVVLLPVPLGRLAEFQPLGSGYR